MLENYLSIQTEIPFESNVEQKTITIKRNAEGIDYAVRELENMRMIVSNPLPRYRETIMTTHCKSVKKGHHCQREVGHDGNHVSISVLNGVTIWSPIMRRQKVMSRRKRKPMCIYCGKESEKVTGAEIYPHRKDLHWKTFYLCKKCNAYVGCHPGTERPLGELANKELRELRIKAHAIFDSIWKSGKLSRGSAYKWLQGKLNINRHECHIGTFTVELCNKTIEACNGINNDW